MILSSETPIEETENAGQLRPIDGSEVKLSLLLEMIENRFDNYSNRYGTY
jgi:hypothetical protein